ncbi:multiubiquitin domain-containing protein [Streptomyces canus]|uniref:multiubiquitin domain-containing protein n=1 Tax=Streptomyces canus TaxID=58343 RepID=UPI00386661E0|nr:multiubiquitin domain-containing protein [Streptomyces canus]
MAAPDSQTETDHTKHPTFVFEVDGVEYTHDRPTITGAQIMEMAGINPADGLVQILPDGTRITITLEETVRLVPGAQFKRRPRFKRG